MYDGDHQKVIEHIQDLAKTLSDDQVVLYNNHVKCLCDGAFYSQLMQMKDGYIDGHDGQWITPPEELEDTMRVYWRNGFQIHVHNNGDLGMRKLLDVVETLNKESPRETIESQSSMLATLLKTKLIESLSWAYWCLQPLTTSTHWLTSTAKMVSELQEFNPWFQ